MGAGFSEAVRVDSCSVEGVGCGAGAGFEAAVVEGVVSSGCGT